jgi:hypothetical protein
VARIADALDTEPDAPPFEVVERLATPPQ